MIIGKKIPPCVLSPEEEKRGRPTSLGEALWVTPGTWALKGNQRFPGSGEGKKGRELHLIETKEKTLDVRDAAAGTSNSSEPLKRIPENER